MRHTRFLPILFLTASVWAQDSTKVAVPPIDPTGTPVADTGMQSKSTITDSTASKTAVSATAKPRGAAKRTSTVAVLPFTGSLSASDLAAITSRFESETIALDSFWVLERRRMDQILKEQGFQQSGACNSSDCQVEVGQLLGVQKLFMGEISQVGGIVTLNLKRVDVGSGRSEFSHSLDLRGTTEDLMRLGCREMALIASGVKKPDSDRSVLVAEKKSSLWPWLVGGAVVVGGGVTAAVLLSQDKTTPAAATTPTVSETQIWVGW